MIARPDHLALTTADENACVAFYVELLGMGLECFGDAARPGEISQAAG